MLFYEKPTDPCIISTQWVNGAGYACVSVIKNGRKLNIGQHRLVYAAHHNMSLADMKNWSVLHKCDVRNCINPNHLFLGTQADNNADMVAKGRNVVPKPTTGPKLYDNGCSKLTVDDIKAILADYRSYTYAELGARFNVTAAQICRVIQGKTKLSNSVLTTKG